MPREWCKISFELRVARFGSRNFAGGGVARMNPLPYVALIGFNSLAATADERRPARTRFNHGVSFVALSFNQGQSPLQGLVALPPHSPKRPAQPFSPAAPGFPYLHASF